MPRFCISGMSSRSMSRTSRLYSSWQVTNGGGAGALRRRVERGRDLAAGKFEQPIARTLPSRTRSSSARSVSSIGVFGSG